MGEENKKNNSVWNKTTLLIALSLFISSLMLMMFSVWQMFLQKKILFNIEIVLLTTLQVLHILEMFSIRSGTRFYFYMCIFILIMASNIIFLLQNEIKLSFK